jgi:hypothetical protein
VEEEVGGEFVNIVFSGQRNGFTRTVTSIATTAEVFIQDLVIVLRGEVADVVKVFKILFLFKIK